MKPRERSLFAGLGIVFLINPIYLGALLVYPTAGDGFRIDALYFAAFAGLGFVLVLVALADMLSLPERVGLPVTVAGVATGSILGFVVYEQLLTTVLYADPPSTIVGYGHRETVVVATITALLAVGAAVGSRRWSTASVAPLSLAIGFGLFATDRFLPQLVITDALLLAVKADVLGIPFVGGLVYLAALTLGIFIGQHTGSQSGRLSDRPTSV